MRTGWTAAALLAFLSTARSAPAQVADGGFESGTFAGWSADPNWVVVDTSCGYYSGWAGKHWAWSGGTGEPATGVLKSAPFVLDRDAVRLLIAGWSSIGGTGEPRTWNHVTLNLEDGTEVDRVYAPDSVTFVPAFLDGSGHRGKKVYVQAVDDADGATYSMLCIDDVRTADLPGSFRGPAPGLPPFDPAKSVRLEDGEYLVEVSRANGSITRLRDKMGGLDLILEPRLAGSFRFALPIPGKEPWQTIEANWVFGRDQALSSARVEGKRLDLRWDGPVRNYLGEKYDASVAMSIELEDGGVLFTLRIDDRTDLPVGEVYFPVLGGIQGLGRNIRELKTTRLVRPRLASRSQGAAKGTDAEHPPQDPHGLCLSAGIFKVFDNMSWLGDQGPEQFYACPASQPEPWIGFYSPRIGRSAFIGARDPAGRKLTMRLELVPASSGTLRDDGNWPRPEELRGDPVGLELSIVDHAGGPGRHVYEAAPVFLRFLEGGGAEMWKAGTAWRAHPRPEAPRATGQAEAPDLGPNVLVVDPSMKDRRSGRPGRKAAASGTSSTARATR
jgi:hypothetical protein